jgi:hypothetical protein
LFSCFWCKHFSTTFKRSYRKSFFIVKQKIMRTPCNIWLCKFLEVVKYSIGFGFPLNILFIFLESMKDFSKPLSIRLIEMSFSILKCKQIEYWKVIPKVSLFIFCFSQIYGFS